MNTAHIMHIHTSDTSVTSCCSWWKSRNFS